MQLYIIWIDGTHLRLEGVEYKCLTGMWQTLYLRYIDGIIFPILLSYTDFFLERLAILVLKLDYSGWASSIIRLLITWLRALAGWQQPLHSLCRLYIPLSSKREDFNNLCHLLCRKNRYNASIFSLFHIRKTRVNSLRPSGAYMRQ